MKNEKLKTEKLKIMLEALDVLEKGLELSNRFEKKRENGEELTIAEMREMAQLIIRREELTDLMTKDMNIDENV